MVFFQGRDEVDLPLLIYDTGDNPRELIDNVFPALIPAEEQYDRMVTWEEVLSRDGVQDPEIGFHTVFGEVNPTWYMEWYKQLRRKHQVHRQIELLIFDMPERITSLEVSDDPLYVYTSAWKFIVPYMHEYHLVSDTFCGLWYNHPLEHLQCHMTRQNPEYYEVLECSIYNWYPTR